MPPIVCEVFKPPFEEQFPFSLHGTIGHFANTNNNTKHTQSKLTLHCRL